ncbi:MAG: PH domain-containing protein [Armatimonadota bacterium]
MTTETPILEVRPSWWRFCWHLVFCWLIVPLVIAIIKRNSLVLRVYHDRLNLETGWLSKRILDIYIADIRTIEVKQSMWQRMLNIGCVEIDTAASADDVLIADGIPDPVGVRNQIQELRQKKVAATDD